MSLYQPPRALALLFFLQMGWVFSFKTASQGVTNKVPPFVSATASIPFLPANSDDDLFGTGARFIENVGQYGESLAGEPALGRILYAYEGLEMPVLFTTNGIIFLQRRVNKLTEKQREEAERSGALNGLVEEGLYYTDRRLTMQWVNANPHVQVKAEQPTGNYYTYAALGGKARGFKKIVYQQLYPGIDLVCHFNRNGKPGFEYRLIVQPGSDAMQVKMRWGGDIKSMQRDDRDYLVIQSDINGIRQSEPVSFYCMGNSCDVLSTPHPATEKVATDFQLNGQEQGFQFPGGYDKTKTLVIDPFVSSTANLTGINSGIAKDIDFDYQGNIYVSGGGNMMSNMLAKYSPSGTLLWTFNGSLVSPAWTFGNNYGGWVVEKTTGKIYLGQGGTSSFRVIRLTTDGTYDNYITTPDNLFQENWKMLWNCDGGTPKILIAGGGSANQSINLGICIPPSTVLTPRNITGQPTGHQDLADFVIDPRTNELYTLFAQGFISPITENNRMYKHRTPYTPGSISWTRLSGFNVMNERANRPYLADGSSFNDNSINGLAVNSRYLFYYDGLNLVAMNKATGATTGSPMTLAMSTVLMQGGIIADECDNVYAGSVNGTIKVYKFDGTRFDDGAAPDISVAGFSGSSVYDLAYDNAKNLLYACGKGFVAAIDISSYCAAAIYTITLQPDCNNFSVKASISPDLPPGSTISYALYNGNTLVSSNDNGTFSGLVINTNYTVKALVDQACGGTQSVKDFNMNNCNVNSPVGAGIYVPSGFTPNGDGLNDLLKAVVVGMKEFKYFALYNRWGDEVFRTTSASRGWDGMINGKKQDSGVFVWIVEAVDFNDQPVRQKGTTTLIR